MAKTDMHIHTVFSDGLSTPRDIVEKAKLMGYDEIAITDHDNVNGIPEALEAGREYDMKVIPGIEIAVETEEGIGLHILGHGIDAEHPKLMEFLDNMIRNRQKRNEELIAVLNRMGYSFAKEELKCGPNSFIGKPVIARLLVDKGYIGSVKEAFGPKVLGSAEARKIKKIKPQAADAIKVIRESGGRAVLAHPIQTRGIGKPGSDKFYKNIDEIINRLKKQWLEGLECFHPDQNEEQSKMFIRMAARHDLIITKGSDFHGSDYMDI